MGQTLPIIGGSKNTQTTPAPQTKPTNDSKFEFIPQPNQQIQQTKPPLATITSNDLKDAFKAFSIDGRYLSQVRFNDTIERLFSKLNIPSMHYTYLSERIYYLLDESKDGKISEDEFLIGMKNVLVDKEFRLKLNMMAMMSRVEDRKYIYFNEIVQFFFKSWIYGYKHLGWLVKRDKNEFISRNIPTPSITQFELWANKFENHIQIYLENDFRECGLDISKPLEWDNFKKWIYKDHNLKLMYTIKSVIIATSLVALDDIKFEESMENSYIRYPSLK